MTAVHPNHRGNGVQMRIAKSIRVVAAVAAVGLIATACGSNLDSSSSGGAASSAAAAPSGSAEGGATGTIKVGFVSAETGPRVGFGEAD